MGIAMVTGRMPDTGDQPEAVLFGWFFIAMATAMIACGAVFSVCLILTGRFLAQRLHYTFCFVIAAIACVFVPFGTVLGIFTILVLVRPSVKQMFAASGPTQTR
jgi:hypothetical protein